MTEAQEPLKVTLKPRRSRPFFARHPWVFADSIAKVEGDPTRQDEAALYSHEGAFIARGLFNPKSKLRLRLYRWDDAPLDDAFWAGRIDQSIDLRQRLPKFATDDDSCRLVFGEADGISGLIVDKLGPVLACQWTSAKLFERRDAIERILTERFPGCSVISLGDASTAEKEGFGEDQVLPVLRSGELKPDEPVIIRHSGLKFQVQPFGGQKTGFFLDQGVNRHRVAAYAANADVLDLFCYSGGFGLAAAKFGQAKTVLGVDSSKAAIALAEKNRDINGLSSESVTFEAQDVAKALKRLKADDRRFGLVVCDPPKYARDRSGIDEALTAYQRLNENAASVVAPGGILATFTCSGIVAAEDFDRALAGSAERCGRTFRVLERLGQPPDHPVNLACPESRYLYGLILRIE
ncbi:methyltransferase domain-containing protein [bacterium]|nr:methyltransferase domain-containing protein [bacterium]